MLPAGKDGIGSDLRAGRGWARSAGFAGGSGRGRGAVRRGGVGGSRRGDPGATSLAHEDDRPAGRDDAHDHHEPDDREDSTSPPGPPVRRGPRGRAIRGPYPQRGWHRLRGRGGKFPLASRRRWGRRRSGRCDRGGARPAEPEPASAASSGSPRMAGSRRGRCPPPASRRTRCRMCGRPGSADHRSRRSGRWRRGQGPPGERRRCRGPAARASARARMARPGADTSAGVPGVAATDAAAASTGVSGPGAASSAANSMKAPQDPQNASPVAFCAPHFGQFMRAAPPVRSPPGSYPTRRRWATRSAAGRP